MADIRTVALDARRVLLAVAVAAGLLHVPASIARAGCCATLPSGCQDADSAPACDGSYHPKKTPEAVRLVLTDVVAALRSDAATLLESPSPPK